MRGAVVKHGHASRDGDRFRSSEYRTWESMRRRCEVETDRQYPSYGGQGIRVCERWRTSFVTFLIDVGCKPSPKHTLDRIDNDGHYEPSNVRWATYQQQARNRRSSRYLTWNGQMLTLAEWSERTGFKRETIARRVEAGWSVGDAMSLPTDERPRKLTRAAVLSIRTRLANGERQAAIARDFGVCPSMISHIARGKNWRAHGQSS
jgi:hypothetical protein